MAAAGPMGGWSPSLPPLDPPLLVYAYVDLYIRIFYASGGSRAGGLGGRQPPHRPRGRHFVLLCDRILS